MENFIVQLVSMSVQASVAIVVVLLLRLLFAKFKVSKKYAMFLWLIPFACLILPWRISSPIAIWEKAPSDYGYENFLNLEEEEIKNNLPKKDGNSGNIIVDADDKTNHGGESEGNHTSSENNAFTGNNIFHENNASNDNNISNENNVSNGNGIIGDNFESNDSSSVSGTGGTALSISQVLEIVTNIWGIVVLGLALYSVLHYIKLKKQLSRRVLICDNVYMVDDIDVPMVVGFLKPEIYIPSGYDSAHLEYVIAHEKTHIRRKDIIVKLAVYCVTCIHWFNPFVWLAFSLMVKDMEMACDEETILNLGQGKKQEYATALLQLSTGRRRVFSVPLAFGEGNTKSRIMNILKYEKTKKIVLILAFAVGIILAVLFLTKAGNNIEGQGEGTENTEDLGTETEKMGNIEDTEDTRDAEETETSEDNDDFTTEIIEYAEPDITTTKVGGVIKDGELVSDEPVYYVEVVPVFDGVESYELTFEWYRRGGSEKLGILYKSANACEYETERGCWSYYPILSGDATIWKDFVLLQYMDFSENQVTYLIYNVEKDEIIATYKVDGMYDYQFAWAFIPETNEAVFIDDLEKVYFYKNGEVVDRTAEFGPTDGWEKRIQVINGKIVIDSINRDIEGVMTHVYHPEDGSVEIGLEQVIIEDNYTNTGTVLLNYAGGYGFAQVEGKCVFINYLTGDMVEPDFQWDQYRYTEILDIDQRAMAFFREDGHWRIIEKSTGNILAQSKNAILVKEQESNGNGDIRMIEVSDDGKVYLKVSHGEKWVQQSADYYYLDYEYYYVD